jgi:AraC-like DNA-binding protein
MGKVLVDITVSLDGFVAGPDDGQELPLGRRGEQLHEWVYGLESWREPHGLAGGEKGRDSELLAEAFDRTGAIIIERRMFENARGWGETPRSTCHPRRAAVARRRRSAVRRPRRRANRARADGSDRLSACRAHSVPRREGCTLTTLVHPARHLLRARDLADARYREPLDVAALARAAHLSPAHFSGEFRRAFGETPHQYLLTRRMERAAALLRNTDRTVADICFTVGLRSVGSFTTTFGRTFGVSPTAYRDAHPPASTRARIPTCVLQAYSRPQSRGMEKTARVRSG